MKESMDFMDCATNFSETLRVLRLSVPPMRGRMRDACVNFKAEDVMPLCDTRKLKKIKKQTNK